MQAGWMKTNRTISACCKDSVYPMETEWMVSLTQIPSLERMIYNVQDRKNLFANIWKTFMGSLEDLKLKKHNYVLLKLLNGDFILEISIFQLEAVTVSSVYCCFLPCQV